MLVGSVNLLSNLEVKRVTQGQYMVWVRLLVQAGLGSALPNYSQTNKDGYNERITKKGPKYLMGRVIQSKILLGCRN